MTYSKFWSPQLAELAPYTPGEQPREPGLIKLNTNENPYPPSPRARAVLNDELAASLRLYPDPDSLALKQAVAAVSGVLPEQVFVGNGSDEVLALAFMAFFRRPVPLLFPDISYSFYPVYSQLFGVDARTVPLRDDFCIDLAAYRGGNVIFPNPNAPTGIATPLDAIEALLRAEPDHLVVVDEAYVDFGAASAAPLVQRYPNLLVVQTLSKSRSLAGMRVGFALGQPALIEGLDRVKNSFNSYPIDRVAEAVAVAALEDHAYFARCCEQIIATREATAEQLAALGFSTLPSSANFLFSRHPNWSGAELFSALRQRRILVRHFAKPRIDQFLRITVGTEQQMAALVGALADIVGEQ